MKAFDHYFGLRGLLDEVEVFIWPNLTETGNLAESLSDNDTAAWLSSSLSDEDYVSGRLSQVSGKPSDNLREMFLERGGYFYYATVALRTGIPPNIAAGCRKHSALTPYSSI